MEREAMHLPRQYWFRAAFVAMIMVFCIDEAQLSSQMFQMIGTVNLTRNGGTTYNGYSSITCASICTANANCSYFYFNPQATSGNCILVSSSSNPNSYYAYTTRNANYQVYYPLLASVPTRRFVLTSTSGSLTAVQSQCQAMGGDLFQPRSWSEAMAVADVTGNGDTLICFWTGLSTTSSSVTTVYNSVWGGFQNTTGFWCPDFPAAGPFSCVQLAYCGLSTWTGHTCSSSLFGICEIRI